MVSDAVDNYCLDWYKPGWYKKPEDDNKQEYYPPKKVEVKPCYTEVKKPAPKPIYPPKKDDHKDDHKDDYKPAHHPPPKDDHKDDHKRPPPKKNEEKKPY